MWFERFVFHFGSVQTRTGTTVWPMPICQCQLDSFATATQSFSSFITPRESVYSERVVYQHSPFCLEISRGVLRWPPTHSLVLYLDVVAKKGRARAKQIPLRGAANPTAAVTHATAIECQMIMITRHWHHISIFLCPNAMLSSQYNTTGTST